jgi:hypothetical protein
MFGGAMTKGNGTDILLVSGTYKVPTCPAKLLDALPHLMDALLAAMSRDVSLLYITMYIPDPVQSCTCKLLFARQEPAMVLRN